MKVIKPGCRLIVIKDHEIWIFIYFMWHYFRDAIIIPLVNCGTSFFAGFIIFAVIGFMAADMGVGVEKVITSGIEPDHDLSSFRLSLWAIIVNSSIIQRKCGVW